MSAGQQSGKANTTTQRSVILLETQEIFGEKTLSKGRMTETISQTYFLLHSIHPALNISDK